MTNLNFKYILLLLVIIMGSSYLSHAQSIDKEKLLQFEESITRGEEFLQNKDYAKAKAEYQKALAIDPSSRFAKDKLVQIRKVYIDPKDETDFADAVASGDRLSASGSYREAKAKYEAALLIKPEDRSVREKLGNVDKLDVEKNQRLKEYETLIAAADKDLSEKNYEAAKPKYEQAALLNTEEVYAKNKIKEIDAILAAQKALDDSYNTEINLADEAYMNRDFALAKVKYQQAARLKPSENYPNSMLERVNESIKTQATNAIANEAELKKRQEEEARLALLRAEEEARLEKLRIEEEVKLAQLKAEEEATEKATREAEELAARQIEEKRLADSLQLAEETAANQAALAAQTQAEELRLAKLAEEKRIADSLQLAKETAISEAALAEENAAKEAALEAQTQAEELRLAQLAEEKRIADSIQIEKETAVQQALREEQLAQSKAEELRLAELAELKAKEDAQKAELKAKEDAERDEQLREQEKLQAEQLREQEKLQAEQLREQEKIKAEQLREQEALAEAARIEEERIRQLEFERTSIADREYNEAIENGNKLYSEEDFPSAMKMFEKAVELKPMEDYPRDRLIQINNIVLERMKNNLDAYNKFVAAGDLAYQTNVFDRALEEFEKALEMRPEETYPTLMISKIKKLMEDNSIVGLVTEPIIILNGHEQRFRFNTIDMRLRKNNYILIKARRTTEYTPKVFINYGKDGMKSGGIVMKGIETEETVDYLLRISVQDKWYRVDNNYITLYPEGGDLEISSMHISQGDIQPVVVQQEQ